MAATPASIEEQVVEQAARVHAATAELALSCAALDACGSWAGIGMRSCAHWLSVKAGFELWHAAALVEVGHALLRLPLIAAAFASGELSFDKVRALITVATADTEESWLLTARTAAGPQLARICRAVRQSLDASDPERAQQLASRRAMRSWWRDDGMLEIIALLPPEDGALVLAAIESAATDAVHETNRSSAKDLKRDQICADALVAVCSAWVSNQSPLPLIAPTRQMVIHVDAAQLSLPDGEGRCTIEGGPTLSRSAMEWMSCDADVLRIIERGGTSLDIGRTRRLVSPRLRLALHARDRVCRYPGCSVPASRGEAHHVRHWLHGGETSLDNLVMLCRFHHRRHHDGAFAIRADHDGLVFLGGDGREIGGSGSSGTAPSAAMTRAGP